MQTDFKHLKWKLINQEGLSPKQADKRIEELKEIMKKNKKKAKKKIGCNF